MLRQDSAPFQFDRCPLPVREFVLQILDAFPILQNLAFLRKSRPDSDHIILHINHRNDEDRVLHLEDRRTAVQKL